MLCQHKFCESEATKSLTVTVLDADPALSKHAYCALHAEIAKLAVIQAATFTERLHVISTRIDDIEDDDIMEIQAAAALEEK